MCQDTGDIPKMFSVVGATGNSSTGIWVVMGIERINKFMMSWCHGGRLASFASFNTSSLFMGLPVIKFI